MACKPLIAPTAAIVLPLLLARRFIYSHPLALELCNKEMVRRQKEEEEEEIKLKASERAEHIQAPIVRRRNRLCRCYWQLELVCGRRRCRKEMKPQTRETRD